MTSVLSSGGPKFDSPAAFLPLSPTRSNIAWHFPAFHLPATIQERIVPYPLSGGKRENPSTPLPQFPCRNRHRKRTLVLSLCAHEAGADARRCFTGYIQVRYPSGTAAVRYVCVCTAPPSAPPCTCTCFHPCQPPGWERTGGSQPLCHSLPIPSSPSQPALCCPCFSFWKTGGLSPDTQGREPKLKHLFISAPCNPWEEHRPR